MTSSVDKDYLDHYVEAHPLKKKSETSGLMIVDGLKILKVVGYSDDGKTIFTGDPRGFLCPLINSPCNPSCDHMVKMGRKHYCKENLPKVYGGGNLARWLKYSRETGLWCPIW